MDPDSDFSVTRHLLGGAAVVAPKGEMDLATVPAVREELRAAQADARVVVLDLREVGFMDSSALRLLVELQRDADRDGFAFACVRGPASLHRLIELSGLEGRVRMVDEVEQAVRGDGADGR